jgi:hypothetical protein
MSWAIPITARISQRRRSGEVAAAGELTRRTTVLSDSGGFEQVGNDAVPGFSTL